ncbi:hypothetical protein C0995_014019 [Termitomyces sp. Mi166|nr:hypothetical protein C0995_014019 [Termitomyces sp. Mi166\
MNIQDSYRLPEGMKRIGYDADTQVYTFQDRDGKLYKGEPGADYGVLTPVERITIGSTRAGAFDSGQPRDSSSVSSDSVPSSFHDILPATSITSTKAPVDKPFLSPIPLTLSSEGGRSATRSRFVEAVRKSTVPRMQGVVHELRRSVTTARSKNHPAADSENLLPPGSSDLSRSMSMTSTRSDRSPENTERALHRGSHDLSRIHRLEHNDTMSEMSSRLNLKLSAIQVDMRQLSSPLPDKILCDV